MKKKFSITCFLLIISLPFSYAKEYTVFDVVGDSISEGVNPDLTPTNYGWVDMLFGYGGGSLPPPKTNTIYTLWSRITVYNDAHSGSMAIQWAMDSNTWLTTVKNHHPDLVVVYIGGNDFLFYGIDGMISTTEQTQYRNNLRSIVSTLQANTPVPDIVLGNYYDLFDGFSPSVSSTSTYQAFSYSVITLNQIIQQVAIEKGCYQVPIYTDFFHHCYGIDFGDSAHLSPDYVKRPYNTSFDIHPDTNGHGKIYDDMYAKMQELKYPPTFVEKWKSLDEDW